MEIYERYIFVINLQSLKLNTLNNHIYRTTQPQKYQGLLLELITAKRKKKQILTNSISTNTDVV